jgi:hypothetical protein
MCKYHCIYQSYFTPSFAATRNENAVKTPAMEKIYDRVVNSTPNFVKNQKETIL